MEPLPPADDLRLEPVEDGHPGDPVVSDVTGRLWRVRSRPSAAAVDLLLAVIALLLFVAISAALIL
jgi:hypothetical protein